MEWKYALFGTGLFLIVGGLAAFQFLRDTKQALAVKNRPRQPWEDPELIAQATSFTSNINSQQTHRSRPGG